MANVSNPNTPLLALFSELLFSFFCGLDHGGNGSSGFCNRWWSWRSAYTARNASRKSWRPSRRSRVCAHISGIHFATTVFQILILYFLLWASRYWNIQHWYTTQQGHSDRQCNRGRSHQSPPKDWEKSKQLAVRVNQFRILNDHAYSFYGSWPWKQRKKGHYWGSGAPNSPAETCFKALNKSS